VKIRQSISAAAARQLLFRPGNRPAALIGWMTTGADAAPMASRGRNRSILGPMANPEHVALLNKSVMEWNADRRLNSKPN